MKGTTILLCAFLTIQILPQVKAEVPACQGILTILGGSAENNDTIFTCVNTPLTLKDLSLLDGILSNRDWDFGDGTFELDALISTQTVHSYELEGAYTVTLSVSSALCSPTSAVKTVIVLGNPLFNPTVTPIDCFGNCNGSITVDFLSPNTAFYHVYWQLTGLENPTISDLCPGDYSAIIADVIGCTDMSVGPFNLPEPELLVATISSLDTLDICPADGPVDLILSIAGGTGEYQSLWSSSTVISTVSASLAQFIPTPQGLNQVYSVTVTDAYGCSVTDSIYMRAASSSLLGLVTVGPTEPCINCKVFQLHYDAIPGEWEVITSVITDNDGNYNFGLIENFLPFVLMSNPDPQIHLMVPTGFYPNAHTWTGATVFSDVCGLALDKHIILAEPMDFNGSNSLSGTVYHSNGPGKVATEEDPIPLIDVVVEKTPPGQAQGRVSTNEQGQYEFNFVPNSDTTYTLYVNIPGVPVTTTYEILADNGDEMFTQLDFCLNEDSTELNICQVEEQVITGGDIPSDSQGLSLYPNPNNGRFTIQTGTFADADSEMRIVNPLGQVVFQKHYAQTPYTINMVNLAEGYHVVQIMSSSRAESAPIIVLKN